ncbi:nanos homolog 2-like [Frankliniella occidentalis]|uniref:Nanos homolog 2-like n=1 Tax=Frankliniella occidentalis TaxID=133901 RepID=A0A9C6X6N8_FRAOC|nr:nanos homolog 2-like [Frankliniella occidentalis]
MRTRGFVAGEWCRLCRNNGETFEVLSSHTLHADVVGTRLTTCPVLQQLMCDICGATGVLAQTRSHCPEGRAASVMLQLKKTERRSGRIV